MISSLFARQIHAVEPFSPMGSTRVKFVFGLAVLSLIFLSSTMHARAQEKPEVTPSPSASPTASPVPAAAPSQVSAPAAQKANPRPVVVVKAAPEPFDKASVEQMAEQCVMLETEAGEIALEMLPEAAPESVRNFLNLSATGAFDGTTFSRVVPDFVIQGGNLTTREKLTTELARRAQRPVPDEPNYLRHVRGIASMARSDKPNSATTHFFILVTDASSLDGKFAAFGRVVHGMTVVDRINRESVVGDKPVHPIRLKRAVVAPCAEKEKQPEK
jgi:peptidyl-prolyl cis-trans isomerase B (cyclophilin B)